MHIHTPVRGKSLNKTINNPSISKFYQIPASKNQYLLLLKYFGFIATVFGISKKVSPSNVEHRFRVGYHSLGSFTFCAAHITVMSLCRWRRIHIHLAILPCMYMCMCSIILWMSMIILMTMNRFRAQVGNLGNSQEEIAQNTLQRSQ